MGNWKLLPRSAAAAAAAATTRRPSGGLASRCDETVNVDTRDRSRGEAEFMDGAVQTSAAGSRQDGARPGAWHGCMGEAGVRCTRRAREGQSQRPRAYRPGVRAPGKPQWRERVRVPAVNAGWNRARFKQGACCRADVGRSREPGGVGVSGMQGARRLFGAHRPPFQPGNAWWLGGTCPAALPQAEAATVACSSIPAGCQCSTRGPLAHWAAVGVRCWLLSACGVTNGVLSRARA